MRVIDLIERLQQFDPELPVLVEGYEGGCNDMGNVFEIDIIRDANSEWYYGAHEKVKDLAENVIQDFAKEGKFPTKGLLIR